MGCLDENTLTALAQGSLAADRLQRAEQHLDGCPECRWLLAELAQPDGRAPYHAALQRGDKVGRYVLIERIGSGGMGVVYAAYDPQLDRRVALKLLQKRWLDPEQAERMQSRLRREAQAMARLSHPNVLPVHDIGLVGGQLYLVTEFVAGGSLRQWLQAAPRSWSEIVAAFVAAGKGLQAAHRAGLLHCDFKPDNILRDHDGRILVGDFGLARIAAAADAMEDTAARAVSGDAGDSLAAGTPAYMAPEQFRREPATSQTDQFSFCVALYEALYGELPYPGRTLAELRAAVLTGTLRRLPVRPAPASVRRVLVRGLSRAPAARFGSMDEVLRPLARAPRPWRRTALFAAGLGLALGTAWTVGRPATRRLAECRAAAEPIDPHWDAAQRSLRRAGATEPTPPLAALLDAYRGSWKAAMLEACTATRVRSEQSEATFQLRAACLRERLDGVRTLTALLAEGSGPALARLHEAAEVMDSVRRCDVLHVLSARGQPPQPALAAQVTALRSRLAQTTVLLNAGLYERCARSADEILRTARALGHRPLLAEALLLQGSLELATGARARGEATLQEALWTAEAARHDEVAAQAWVKLVEAVHDQPELRTEAHKRSAHAEAALERLGGDAQLTRTLTALRKTLQP